MLTKSLCVSRNKEEINKSKHWKRCWMFIVYCVKWRTEKILQNICNAFQQSIQINPYLVKKSYILFNNVLVFFLRSLKTHWRAGDLEINLNFPYGELDLKCLGLQSKSMWWFSSASNGLQ